jgi:hypothetical protein
MILEDCRVYRVQYTVIGQNKQVLSVFRGVCVVAMDVADVVDQIRKSCVGIEVTITGPDGQLFHSVAEDVEIESAELVGRLHGITDRSYRAIKQSDRLRD